MADEKLTQIANSVTTLDGDELFYVVDTPSGTPARGKMTATNLEKAGRTLIHAGDQQPYWTDATTFLTVPNVGTASGALTANRLYMVPVRVTARRSMTKLAVVVTALSASTGIRLGIYNANQSTGQPTTLIEDAGIVDTSTGTGATGRIEKTITSTLDPGLYYLAGLSDGAPSALRFGSPIPSTVGTQFGAASSTPNCWLFRSGVTYQAFATSNSDESGQTYSVGAANGLLIGIR